MRVRDIMTQEIAFISPTATVAAAAQLMFKAQLGELPVIDGNRALVGMITERDLSRRAGPGSLRSPPTAAGSGENRLPVEYDRALDRKVADVMTVDVTIATEDMTLRDAADIMEERRLKRLPVACGRRMVGIIARADVLRAIASLPAHQPGADNVLRERVWNELCKQPWNAARGHITVHRGVVHLWGLITSERQREAILMAVERIPGVHSVRDHLFWVETR